MKTIHSLSKGMGASCSWSVTISPMRGYMVVPCDLYFTLEKKIQRFLEMSLTSYRVPLEEQKKAIGIVLQMDLRTIAEGAIQSLTTKLRSHFTVDPAIAY